MLSHVLLLSRVVGRDVLGAGGAVLGRLTDLVVRLDGATEPRVERLVISRRRASTLMLPWSEVGQVHARGIRLVTSDVRGFEIASAADALGDGEILLRRDVLDTQVVDLIGQRLARVADVVLHRTDGHGLSVYGVEVGFGGVLRRLGLGGVSGNTDDVVAWTDLHLTSERGHRVQLSAARAAVHRVDPRSLAALVSRVDVGTAAEILQARGPAVAEEALRAVHPDLTARLRRALPRSRPLLRSRVWQRRHLNWRRP